MMEGDYSKARSGEVAPERKAALGTAADRLDVERFLKEVEDSPTALRDGGIGWIRRACSRRCVARSARVSDLLTFDLVGPLRSDSLCLMGRLGRAKGSSNNRKTVAIKCGLRYRVDWRDYSRRGRDAALSPSVVRECRLSRSPVWGGGGGRELNFHVLFAFALLMYVVCVADRETWADGCTCPGLTSPTTGYGSCNPWMAPILLAPE